MPMSARPRTGAAGLGPARERGAFHAHIASPESRKGWPWRGKHHGDLLAHAPGRTARRSSRGPTTPSPKNVFGRREVRSMSWSRARTSRGRLGGQRAHGAHRDDLFDPERLQRPDVRAGRHLRGQKPVAPAVPGQERDPFAPDLRDRDGIGRKSPNGVETSTSSRSFTPSISYSPLPPITAMRVVIPRLSRICTLVDEPRALDQAPRTRRAPALHRRFPHRGNS